MVARSTAAGEHQEEGRGIRQASRSTALQRAGAGQELDWLADVAGWVLVVPAVAGQHEAVLVEVPGSVERDQTGQHAGAGQDLDRLADVAGWVLVVGVVARSTAAGEHQDEGHGINPASASSSSGGGWGGTGFTFARRFRAHSPGFAPEG